MTNRKRLHLSFRQALFAGLASAALLGSSAAYAAPAAIHISAGPMDSALLALAAQTHEQLVFTPSLVAGLRAASLTGNFTVEDALTRLLAGTNIIATRAGPAGFVLRMSTTAQTTSVTKGASEVQAAGPFVGSDPVTRADGPVAAHGLTDKGPIQSNTVSEVEVTGSHLRGAPPASPLVVLTRSDIERSGQSTIAGALQALPQNFSGGAAEGNEMTGGDKVSRNPNFSTAINLRGLGNNATLVLIDGHRMAGSGTFGDFSDISAIPSSAVERVEVLLDGASAVYGSDAVGGVVNIIMRKSFDGAETRLEGGSGTSGSPGEFQASQTAGKRWASGGIVASYEYQQRDALPAADRRFVANADLRSLGGTDQRLIFSFPGNIIAANAAGALVPSFAIPSGQSGVGLLPSQFQAGAINLTNQRLGEDILPRQTLQSVYIAADQEVGDRLKLTADARYSLRKYDVVQAASATQLSVTRANPFFVSPTGGSSDIIAYSFVGDVPNPESSGSVETLGFSLGGTLQLFGDWRSDAYLTYGRDDENSRTNRIVNSNALSEALGTTADNPATAFSTARSGFFNPFSGTAGSNSPAVLSFIDSGFSQTHIRDQVTSANLQADGTVWTLPAGAVKLAVGVQTRREVLQRQGVSFVATAAPTAQSGTDIARNVTAGYVEVRAPFFGPDNARPGFERLDVTLAGRVENYETEGSTANPQVGVLWQPVSDLRIRGTFGTSFRAPSLRELHDLASYGAQLLNFGTAKVRTLNLSGGNPTLKPETAASFTAGFDYQPARWPGLTLGATWFDIDYKNKIDKPVSSSLVGALNDPALTAFVSRIAPNTSAADLSRITALLTSAAFNTAGGTFPATDYGAIVDNRYVNTATLHVRGIDFSGGYHFDLGSDRIALAGSATYTLNYDQQLTPTSRTINEVGLATFPVRFRSRMTADWTRDRVTAGIAFNYVSSYRDQLGVHIGDQPTVDLQLRLAPAEAGAMRGVAITLNLRNVFDREPPFYNNAFGIGYDPTNADPIGRVASIQLIKAW